MLQEPKCEGDKENSSPDGGHFTTSGCTALLGCYRQPCDWIPLLPKRPENAESVFERHAGLDIALGTIFLAPLLSYFLRCISGYLLLLIIRHSPFAICLSWISTLSIYEVVCTLDSQRESMIMHCLRHFHHPLLLPFWPHSRCITTDPRRDTHVLLDNFAAGGSQPPPRPLDRFGIQLCPRDPC